MLEKAHGESLSKRGKEEQKEKKSHWGKRGGLKIQAHLASTNNQQPAEVPEEGNTTILARIGGKGKKKEKKDMF